MSIGAAIQVRSVLRAARMDRGLLLNFTKSKLELKRVVARAISA